LPTPEETEAAAAALVAFAFDEEDKDEAKHAMSAAAAASVSSGVGKSLADSFRMKRSSVATCTGKPRSQSRKPGVFAFGKLSLICRLLMSFAHDVG
jgi:hypothetical protein